MVFNPEMTPFQELSPRVEDSINLKRKEKISEARPSLLRHDGGYTIGIDSSPEVCESI